LREVFPLRRIARSLSVPLALTIVGGSILLSEAANLVVKAIPVPRGFEEITMNVVSGRISMWGSVFAAVIVAPVVEELLFRGLILRGFMAAYGVRKAVLASALLFGLSHLNPWQFVPSFALGLLFAWWRVETGSLLPGIFGHALNNGLGVASAAVISIRSHDGRDLTSTQHLWVDLIGLGLAGIGLWWIVREFKKAKAAFVLLEGLL